MRKACRQKYTEAWKTTWFGFKYANCQSIVQATASSILWDQPWYTLPKYPIYLPGILLEGHCIHLICLTWIIWEYHRRAVIAMHLTGPLSWEGQTHICTDTYHFSQDASSGMHWGLLKATPIYGLTFTWFGQQTDLGLSAGLSPKIQRQHSQQDSSDHWNKVRSPTQIWLYYSNIIW